MTYDVVCSGVRLGVWLLSAHLLGYMRYPFGLSSGCHEDSWIMCFVTQIKVLPNNPDRRECDIAQNPGRYGVSVMRYCVQVRRFLLVSANQYMHGWYLWLIVKSRLGPGQGTLHNFFLFPSCGAVSEAEPISKLNRFSDSVHCAGHVFSLLRPFGASLCYPGQQRSVGRHARWSTWRTVMSSEILRAETVHILLDSNALLGLCFWTLV